MALIEETKCPGCGKPSEFPPLFHCAACLKDTMEKMTAEDWKREIGAICDTVLGKQP